jgi:hypothetical protein
VVRDGRDLWEVQCYNCVRCSIGFNGGYNEINSEILFSGISWDASG